MSGVVSESELAEEPPGTIEKIRLNLKIQMLQNGYSRKSYFLNDFWSFALIWIRQNGKNVLEVGF